MARSVAEKDRIRWLVLQKIYDATDGDTTSLFDYEAIADATGVTLDDLWAAMRWWAERDPPVLDLSSDVGSITAYGVESYEETARELNSRGASTPERAQQIIHNHFSGPVGSYQTGAHSVANVVQNVHGEDAGHLLKMLAEIRSHIEAGETEDREFAVATTSKLERELQAPNPDRSKLAKFGTALQAVLTGTATTLLTAWLKKMTGL